MLNTQTWLDFLPEEKHHSLGQVIAHLRVTWERSGCHRGHQNLRIDGERLRRHTERRLPWREWSLRGHGSQRLEPALGSVKAEQLGRPSLLWKPVWHPVPISALAPWIDPAAPSGGSRKVMAKPFSVHVTTQNTSLLAISLRLQWYERGCGLFQKSHSKYRIRIRLHVLQQRPVLASLLTGIMANNGSHCSESASRRR